MVCFECGNECEGVVCPSCQTERLERAKAKKHLKRRTCLDQLMQALGVLIALLMM